MIVECNSQETRGKRRKTNLNLTPRYRRGKRTKQTEASDPADLDFWNSEETKKEKKVEESAQRRSTTYNKPQSDLDFNSESIMINEFTESGAMESVKSKEENFDEYSKKREMKRGKTKRLVAQWSDRMQERKTMSFEKKRFETELTDTLKIARERIFS